MTHRLAALPVWFNENRVGGRPTCLGIHGPDVRLVAERRVHQFCSVIDAPYPSGKMLKMRVIAGCLLGKALIGSGPCQNCEQTSAVNPVFEPQSQPENWRIPAPLSGSRAPLGRQAMAAVSLAVLLISPVSGMEHPLQELGFERSLNQWELRRTWQQQTKVAKPSPGNPQETAKRPVPQIRRISAVALLKPISGSIKIRRDRYVAIILSEAKRHRVDPNLVHAVIQAESAYRPNAKSPAGACGLMQLMPATARRFGVRDIWDPEQNIGGGVAYLRFLLDRFAGDIPLVLAAYNAGEGAVAKYGNKIPPYRETREYVRKVMGYFG
ncbi:soluble lytic murein transglycosylase-like protein [Thiorhodovibrio frisius]|uniref:Soluble lytic murein transglycosylase-like protein n=2 Tax=Thiorhodovibrio frisius TaxID=631362 RepID=H8YWI3_9GAMM|nr:soluble lytic murein transglycosylase-like protein [Thiorhodovibrio frisius]